MTQRYSNRLAGPTARWAAALSLLLAACTHTPPAGPAPAPVAAAGPARLRPVAWPGAAASHAPVPADTSHGALAGILADVRRRSFDFNPAKGAGLTAGNYRQHLAATLAAGRYTVAADTTGRGGVAWQLALTLRGIGRAGAAGLRPVADTARPTLAGGHASYRQPGFAVDYDNTEAGLRQTYRVAARPAGTGPVQVTLALATSLRAEASADTAVVFSQGGSHAPVLHYGSLRAWDATGRRLPATLRLAADGNTLALVVDDARAAYPLTIDPLASTAGATLSGATAGDLYATGVTLAGDLNGDGYGDVAVGAPGYNSSTGIVYFYAGSSTGLAATAAGATSGGDTGWAFGTSVAGAGDFNGDGYGDLLVGAPGYSSNAGILFLLAGNASFFSTPLASYTSATGPAGSRLGAAAAGIGDFNGDGYDDAVAGGPTFNSNAGSYFVFYGNAGPSLGTYGAFGGGAGSQAGASVAGLGDIDGDGYADLAVGSPGTNNVLVAKGISGTNFGSTTRFLLTPGTTGSGTSVAGPGDVNGDGYADLLIGAPGAGTGGVVYVYQGSPSLAAGTAPTATLANPNAVAGDQYGQALSGAGDVNGDGYADFAVGSPGYTGGDGKGRAYVYGGTGTAGTYAAPQAYAGESSGDRFGSSLSGGDCNGDGYGDLLVGAPANSSSTGRAYAYYGSPAALLTTPTTSLPDPGATANDSFGTSVASAGDVDGDGYADVLVGAYGTTSGQGRAYLYRGSASGLLTPAAATLTDPAAATNDNFGYSVAGAGDVDGDGYADVLVGAFGTTSGQGRAYLYRGGGGGLAATPAATLPDPGATANDYFGFSVAGAGDVDGDGYSDVLVGAYGSAGSRGRAYFYRGSASGLLTSAAASLANPAATPNDNFGRSVAGAGDVDGDGYADVLVGAFGTTGGQGRAYLYRGSSAGLAATPAATLTDPAAATNDYFGRSVAGAGDVDGDGYSDVLVGAYGTTNFQGRAYLYRGGGGGLGTTPTTTLTDPAAAASDYFGLSVASAGDVDGDGYSDVLVGAYGTSSNQGRSYLYRGSSTGLLAAAAVTLTTPTAANSDFFGTCVASAGDVNGDGYSDVLVGAPGADGFQGRLYLYRGNQGAARAGGLRLYNTDYTPIGASNYASNQFGLGLTARNASGRIQARVVWEVVGRGQGFSHASPLANSTAYTGRGAWTNLPASGTATELRVLATKVSRASKVRARLEYASSPLAAGPSAGTGGPASRVRYGPWTYVAAQQAGQSTSAATPLPVQLVAFTARRQSAALVRLAWATASEVHNAGFGVESSPDGQTWTRRAFVAGAGSSATARPYALDVAEAGAAYYRLAQTDADGTVAYSPVQYVGGGGAGLSLYPNPASGGAATLLGAAPGAAVTVLDALGRPVATATADATGTARLALPAGLPTGVYVVRAGAKAVRLTVE